MPLSLTNGSETRAEPGNGQNSAANGRANRLGPSRVVRDDTAPPPPETGAAVLDLRDHCIFAGSKDTLPLFFIPPEGWIGGKVEVRVEVGLRTLRRVRTQAISYQREP